MAIKDTDLLIVQRPETSIHYKLKVSDLASSSLPDGVYQGDHLEWNGTEWVPTSVIDGGAY